MINENFARLLHAQSPSVRCIDNNNRTFNGGVVYKVMTNTSYSTGGSSDAAGFMVVGGGDTPATPSDIALETPYVRFTIGQYTPESDLVISNHTSITDTRTILGKSCCYRNDTASPIIVKEIGILAFSYGSGVHYSLVARKILKTPVTIEPGKTARFTYTIGIPNSDD